MNDIKAGDLVVVIREGVNCPMDCDKGPDHMGTIFRVGSIETMGLVCSGCGASKGVAAVAVPETPIGKAVFRPQRLKRIPPLGELEGVRDALSERSPQKVRTP